MYWIINFHAESHKNLDCWRISETQNGRRRPILWKYDETACVLHNLLKMHRSTSYLMQPLTYYRGRFLSNLAKIGQHFFLKLRIDLKWREMGSKSDFLSSKIQKNESCALIWNGQKCDRKWFSVIQNFPKKIKVEYRSEMARNAIKIDFRSSKLAASYLMQPLTYYRGRFLSNLAKIGQHFFLKLRIDLKWREMGSKSDFLSSKMAVGGHFVTKFRKTKVAHWYEMARNAIESDFRSSKISKKNKSWVSIWNGEKCDQNWFSVIQTGRFIFDAATDLL